MRKYVVFAGVLAALAIPASAIAVSLHPPHVGSGCGPGEIGTFHFVNNQLGNPGLPNGVLTYSFNGGSSGSTGPSMNNGPTQHFIVSSTGTIASASTNLPGKLVLSDFSCKKK